MNKISCDICIDLIPLVKDGVASDESCDAVMNHIGKCKQCKILFEDIYDENKIESENIVMDDKKVISKMRNQLVLGGLILIIFGSILGVSISESQNMLYNILLMPFIGIISYLALNNKGIFTPIVMFAFVGIFNTIKYLINDEYEYSNFIDIIEGAFSWALIYSALCALGVLIGFLLYIAFKKENK